VSGLRLLA